MAERPKDLIYARDEKPPPVPLIAIGFQHVAVICPYLVMVALVAEAAKLPQEAARNAMGLAMIAVAFLTVCKACASGESARAISALPWFLQSIFRRRCWPRRFLDFLWHAAW